MNLFLVSAGLCLMAAEHPIPALNEGANHPLTLDIFDLPSTRQYVVAEGMGYFPVLNQNGNELTAVFRAGGGHLGLGGSLLISSTTAEATIWSTPLTVVDGPADDRNPAVGITTDRRIVVAYQEQNSYNEEGRYSPERNQAACMLTWSDDGGLTWSPPKPLGVPGLESSSPYGRIYPLDDGTLVMNLYGPYSEAVPGGKRSTNDYRDFAYTVYSTDGGETWGDPHRIAEGHNETALLPLGSGLLLAAARSERSGQLDYLRSEDNGRTWEEPRRLTGPDKHPADWLLLSNGWILLLYGDRSVEDKQIRGMISRDRGRTWDIRADLLFSRPVRGDFGYPSAVRLESGTVAVMYYWAGAARDAYDGSRARVYVNRMDESELIQALQSIYQ